MNSASEYPDWIKVTGLRKKEFKETFNLLKQKHINTVCIGANCPNRYECFSNHTATFMILGGVCTRACRYCYVKTGKPESVDHDEPKRIAEAAKKLGLEYVVVTCVTRDDLADGGASIFVETINALKQRNPKCRIEVLISDLRGNWKALEQIINSGPDVLGHNIETVEALHPKMKPSSDYTLSLNLLKKSKEMDDSIKTKSGIMLGLGESMDQMISTMRDLRDSGCDFLTIGQYLQPGRGHEPVHRFYTPEEFKELGELATSMGFDYVESAPMVRSSYHARNLMEVLDG